MQLSRQRISEEYCVYVCVQLLSCVYLFVIPWTAAHRLICPWDFPGKNTGMGCQPFPSPGDFPDPRIEPRSPALASGFFTTELLWKPCENLRSGKK